MVKNLNKKYFKGIALAVIIIFLSAYFMTTQYKNQRIYAGYGYDIIEAFSKNNNGNFIIIDKGNYSLSVFKNYKKFRDYDVTIGKKPGTKREPGDDRTPEGIFRVKSIEKVSHWAYDFPEDTLPPVIGAYGPWFIRLDVPGFEGIGIHGFINDDWLGKRNSNGCIRLNNKQLNELVKLVKPGMLVIIQPSEEDFEFDIKQTYFKDHEAAIDQPAEPDL
jgi:hypothetical protein